MGRMKRRIKRVAAATLVLGGACGNDNPGPFDASQIALTICKALQTCNPSDFTAYYMSLQQCQQELLADYADYAQENPSCAAAYSQFLICFYEAYADTCDYYATYYAVFDGTLCRNEQQRVNVACEDEYSY